MTENGATPMTTRTNRLIINASASGLKVVGNTLHAVYCTTKSAPHHSMTHRANLAVVEGFPR